MERIDSVDGAIRMMVAFPGSSKVFNRALAAGSAMVSTDWMITTCLDDSHGDLDKNVDICLICSSLIMGAVFLVRLIFSASSDVSNSPW